MKIICTKDMLVNGMNIALRAVPGKSTMPILDYVLIDAHGDSIRLIANDMETGIQTTISGEIIEEGVAGVTAKVFAEIIKRFPDGDVVVDTGEGNVADIRCGKAHFQIPVINGDDFPRLPEITCKDAVTIDQSVLRKMIAQTVFAIAPVASNVLMTGEFLEVSGDKLRIVALDGHRLAIREEKLSQRYEDRSAIVPGKAMNEISKILSTEPGLNAEVYIAESHILFDIGNTIIVTRLLDGKYFDIDRVIPKEFNTQVTIDRELVVDALNRAAVLAKSGLRTPIVMTFGDEQIDLRIAVDTAALEERIDADKDGDDITIGFDPVLVGDALKAIEDDVTDMYLVNSKSPCIIKNERESYVYVVLPVAVAGV